MFFPQEADFSAERERAAFALVPSSPRPQGSAARFAPPLTTVQQDLGHATDYFRSDTTVRGLHEQREIHMISAPPIASSAAIVSSISDWPVRHTSVTRKLRSSALSFNRVISS